MRWVLLSDKVYARRDKKSQKYLFNAQFKKNWDEVQVAPFVFPFLIIEVAIEFGADNSEKHENRKNPFSEEWSVKNNKFLNQIGKSEWKGKWEPTNHPRALLKNTRTVKIVTQPRY